MPTVLQRHPRWKLLGNHWQSLPDRCHSIFYLVQFPCLNPLPSVGVVLFVQLHSSPLHNSNQCCIPGMIVCMSSIMHSSWVIRPCITSACGKCINTVTSSWCRLTSAHFLLRGTNRAQLRRSCTLRRFLQGKASWRNTQPILADTISKPLSSIGRGIRLLRGET